MNHDDDRESIHLEHDGSRENHPPARGDDADILLDVADLDISFRMRSGELRAVNGISYTVKKGETVGLVGESGSGKSVEAYSLLGLLKPPASINGGKAVFEGRDLLTLTPKEREKIRGSEIGIIFQHPASSLDPVFRIGTQMVETVRAFDKTISLSSARALSVEMLREVRMRDPEQVMRQYPGALSGGMLQRVLIAIALLPGPKLLIADEPTTALDVTLQAQVIQLLKELQKRRNMAMLYITHNFGIVAELCDRVSVMCGGYIVEQGTTDDIFYRAAHPYTQHLLEAIPRLDAPPRIPFAAIGGLPADPVAAPQGCVFHPRCSSCTERCRIETPPAATPGPDPEHRVRCWLLA